MTKNLQEIEKIVQSDNPVVLKNFFSFRDESPEIIVHKFNLWSRRFFPQFFFKKDAKFHKEIDLYNVQTYLGIKKSFLNIAFRGAAKTSRTKLFMAFVICNDLLKRRRYMKILCANIKNAEQISTDVYNMLQNSVVRVVYPELFIKKKLDKEKREERMGSFTTATGIKVTAGTVGVDQRGNLMQEARPDWIWFEDFENRKTLRSAVTTVSIWDNMEEARTGLSHDGVCIYSCNYISERGAVHTLVQQTHANRLSLVVPIYNKKTMELAWPDMYSWSDIERMKEEDDDFAGERMCEPSAGFDIVFDRDTLNAMEALQPIRTIAHHKIYKKYDPQSRYGLGADIAGGVGLDSSTTVIIDYDSVPAQVVATYHNNEVKPDSFGDEVARHADRFGECIVSPERNNHGHATIGRLKQIYPTRKIYREREKETKVRIPGRKLIKYEYGWLTHPGNKSNLLMDLAKAVEKGWIALNCPSLIAEAKSYSRDDLMDSPNIDPRLTTRHFDLLIACAIAWKMRHYADISQGEIERQAKVAKEQSEVDFDPYSVL